MSSNYIWNQESNTSFQILYSQKPRVIWSSCAQPTAHSVHLHPEPGENTVPFPAVPSNSCCGMQLGWCLLCSEHGHSFHIRVRISVPQCTSAQPVQCSALPSQLPGSCLLPQFPAEHLAAPSHHTLGVYSHSHMFLLLFSLKYLCVY